MDLPEAGKHCALQPSREADKVAELFQAYKDKGEDGVGPEGKPLMLRNLLEPLTPLSTVELHAIVDLGSTRGLKSCPYQRVWGAGTERLCRDLGLDPADRKVLLLAWKMSAQRMGYFSRQEWNQGGFARSVNDCGYGLAVPALQVWPHSTLLELSLPFFLKGFCLPNRVPEAAGKQPCRRQAGSAVCRGGGEGS